MRRLGIDFGRKRVGLALTDELGRSAYPLSVLANDDKLLRQIASICRGEKVVEVVLGESLNYRRAGNPIMRAILRFKRKLESAIKLPVVLEDETLTTREAIRDPEGEFLPTSDPLLDARAAAILLRQYLSRLK